MHYYQFNIGDYQSHTAHLSDIEDLAYRRLLDWYYLHESPIPDDIPEIARQIRMRSHTESIAIVLGEFFELTKKGWSSVRANREIAKTGEKSAKASASAKARWSKPSDANALPTLSDSNATHNTVHKTQDTKPKKEATDVAIVLPDWMPLETWQAYLSMRKRIKKPPTDYAVKLLINKLNGFREKGQDVKEILERSITSSWQDLYEIAAVKQPFNKYDAITTTVPSSKEKDPALVKLDEDAKKAAAPSLETLQRLAALRQELKNG